MFYIGSIRVNYTMFLYLHKTLKLSLQHKKIGLKFVAPVFSPPRQEQSTWYRFTKRDSRQLKTNIAKK